MTLNRIIEKAYDLIRKGRIEQIDENLYNVVGDHGTYTVAQNINGSITCNCPGFASKKRCSHSLAVIMLKQPALLKSVKREIEKRKKMEN